MTATATKTNYPDYREFGLYLLPRNQHSQYGFSESSSPGRCLLLLDTKSSITPRTAKNANLRLLLQNKEKTIALYIVLPTITRRKIYQYPDQSELLQNLELAYVARNQVITPLEITQQFRAALGDLKGDVANLLDFSVAIGINHNGDTVYNSSYGRFVERQTIDKNGNTTTERLRANLVPLADCLYALNHDGNIEPEALALCSSAYLDMCAKHLQSIKTAQSFAQTIFQTPPKDAPFKKSLDVADSIILSVLNESTELTINHWHEFNQMVLVNEAIDLYGKTLQASTYLEIFDQATDRHNNRHSLHFPTDSAILYKPAVTVLLAPILAKLLLPDANMVSGKIVYSPSIGDGTILSGFTSDLGFHVNEPSLHNYKQLSLFVEEATRINTLRAESESVPVPSYFISNKDLSLIAPTSDFSLSIALLPAGVSPLTTNIPFNDNHGNRYLEHTTDRLDQSLIIEVLEQRQSEGRSLFIGPIESNQIGKVGKGSIHILKWLQAYFFNVSVVDLSSTLFNQNSLPSASRLYIVGNKKPKPDNAIALHDRIDHLHKDFFIPLITSYEQLIGLEQAISLIERSNRIPIYDADITDVPELNETDEEGLVLSDGDKPGIHFVDGFYNLNPSISDKPTELANDGVHDALNNIGTDALAEEIAAIGATDESFTSLTDTAKGPKDDNQGDTASNNEPDTSTDDEGDDRPRVVFQDFSEYLDSDDSDSDDYTGAIGYEEPDAGDFDLDLLTGGSSELDSKMAALANEIENNYLDGENEEESLAEEDHDTEEEDHDTEDDTDSSDDANTADEDVNEYLSADNTQAASNELSAADIEGFNVESIDLTKNQSIDSDQYTITPEKVEENAVNTPSYYTPRFIDDPYPHLIKRNSMPSDKPAQSYSFHAVLYDGVDTAFAHKMAKLKNIALSDVNDRKTVSKGLHRLTSLTLVETHLPALVLTYNNDIETMRIISLINYASSHAYNLALEEFAKEHQLPGDKEDKTVTHELFSLKSESHQQELELMLDYLVDMNDRLSGTVEPFYINDLYKYDSHDFSELYRLAASYQLTPQREARARIVKSIEYVVASGKDRYNEYQAWWWMGLDEALSNLYVRNPTSATPNASLFSPHAKPAVSVEPEYFGLVTKQLFDLVQTNVYSKAFALGVSHLAEYLVPQSDLPILKALTDRLQNPKRISFTDLVSRTILCHTIFIAGVYRYFTQAGTPSERDAWLAQLAQVKAPSFSLVTDNHYLARLALDVNYSRSLLQAPTSPFISEVPRLTRYVSESTYAQSFSLIERDQQPKIHNALLQMQTMWAAKDQNFDMTSWLILETLSNVKSLPSEQVDLLFLATNNMISKRSSYFSVAGLSSAFITLLPLLYKVAKPLNIELVVCAKNASKAIDDCCSKYGIKTYLLGQPIPASISTLNDTVHVYLDPPAGTSIIGPSIVLCDKSFEHLVEPNSLPTLLKNGQALSLHEPTFITRTKMIPAPTNLTVLTNVYEQYTRIFDAMRQLKVLSTSIAQDLFKTHLHNEHQKIQDCSSLRWWFNNQSDVLYKQKPNSIAAYNNLIKELQKKVRTPDEELALNVMVDKTPLQIPSISTCDVDAWVDALASRLSLALNTPQIITEALDNIKNGIQPILIINQEQESLLHHVIVVEQGVTLPFSFFTLHRRAIDKLAQKANKTPEEQARLARLVTDLNKGLHRRDSEVSAIFQQNKKMQTPLIKSAIQCFLQEVQQFAITDITGTISYVNFIKEQSKRLLNSDTAIAFSQLVNTLIQMADDDVIAALPLSPIDTIRTQMERHGYQVQSPETLSYQLMPVSKEKNMWTLESPRQNSQIDAHFVYAFENADAKLLAHKTRHSSLILTAYPNSLHQLDLIADIARSLKPISEIADTVFISLTDPLCQADVQRQLLIGDYMNKRLTDDMSATDLSDQLAAKYYMATAPEYIDYTAQSTDLLSFLALVSQLPLHEQERHLGFFETRRQVQQKYDHSKINRRPSYLHQSVFTRRYEPVTRDDYSLFAHLSKMASNKNIAPSLIDLFAPARDYIHDTYSQYGYQPVNIDDINEAIIKLTNKFKSDLFYMVDTHPHKDYLYQMLSDHSQNPEADYFIELSGDHKKAYIYKHLIKDLSYRGLIARISADLYRHRAFSQFSGDTQIEISTLLVDCQNSYNDILSLCQRVQKLTGISSYIEQLQAQTLAKNLITERIDSICLYDPESNNKLNIPVIICQPKTDLGEIALSKNLPAITTLFNRHFSNNDCLDPSIYLGKNEWLITCGITLPHYSQTIDLNNLICHVINTGVDTSVSTALFNTNGRHLYTDYVGKKALAIAQTHVVFQGMLCAELQTEANEVVHLNHVDIDVMSETNISTWFHLIDDMDMYQSAFGVASEQVLIGHGVHTQYCLTNKALFENTQFHDVAGKLNTAIKMTSYAKAIYTDFTHLFKEILPVTANEYLDYLQKCIADQRPSLKTSLYSAALDEVVDVAIAVADGDISVMLDCHVSSKQALLLELLSSFSIRQNALATVSIENISMKALLQQLKPTSFWVHTDSGRDIDLVQSIISNASDIIRTIEHTLKVIPKAAVEVNPGDRIELKAKSIQAVRS